MLRRPYPATRTLRRIGKGNFGHAMLDDNELESTGESELQRPTLERLRVIAVEQVYYASHRIKNYGVHLAV